MQPIKQITQHIINRLIFLFKNSFIHSHIILSFQVYRSVILSLFIEVCNHNYNPILDYFITLIRSPVLTSSHSSLLPYLMPEATTNLLSVFVDLPTLAFDINGILQYMAFYIWLHSLTVFSEFIHIVACINILFSFYC